MGFLAQSAQNTGGEIQDQGRQRCSVFSLSSKKLVRRRLGATPSEMMEDDNLLYDVLLDTDLLKFQDDLARKLQITKIEHFEHVKDSDLRNIGLSQPAIRRLLKAVKDKRNSLKNTLKKTKNLEKKIRKDSPKFLHIHRENSHSEGEPTCLIAREDVKLFEPLGEGSFGVVKRAIWAQGVGKKLDVAVKCLRNNEGFAEEFMGEVDRMHKLKHPNLIRLYGLVISKPLMMVVELCPGGALLDRLRHPQKPVLLLTQLLSFGLQIVDGMSYLETKSFIHRDLATRNVLLATEDEQTVKIGDFGLMRALRNNEEHYVMTGRKKVPFAWCPPESLIKRQFSHASDVWSFGVTLWEMFSFGEEPWCGYAGPEVLQKVSAGERLTKPDPCPSSIYQLMKQCWSSEPSQRPTFAALKDLLKESEIQRGDSKESQTGEGLLEITPGDKILVVDGGPESYYWLGQNIRTRKIGKFARKLVSIDEVRVSGKDISHPIKGSFVHTGHGDGKGGTSWGHPDKIDDIYLRNPMPLIDFREEEKKKSLNVEQITIPKPPRSERHSSRGNYYGGATSGSPVSNHFDAFDQCTTHNSDAISFTSAVSGGATSTDESKESTKSADSWHSSPAADVPFNKTYYSVVPSDSTPIQANDNRLYDQVPPDPDDPFEIPSQIKDLTSSQRYSQMYSTIVKSLPTRETSNESNGKHSFIIGESVLRQTSVSPKKSVVSHQTNVISSPERSVVSTKTSVTSPLVSSPTERKVSPRTTNSTSYLTRQLDLTSTSSMSNESSVSPVQTPFTYEKRTSIPPDVVLSVGTTRRSNNNMNDYAQRQNVISAEFSRLNLNNTSSNANHGTMTVNPSQFNIWRLNAPVSPSNAFSTTFSTSPTNAFSTTFSNSPTNAFSTTFSNSVNSSTWTTHKIVQQTWLPSHQQNARTFSEPDVSRSSCVLQPMSTKKSLGDGLDSNGAVKSVAPKQVLDMFDPLADKPPDHLVSQVRQSVPFVSLERCGQVLKRCNLDVQSAIQELKIQKLVDMGLGDRDACQRVLAKSSWNIEIAASAILE